MCSSTPELPPGFRFHPTDEELITHYLKNQILSRTCPVSIIPELNIYKYDPWQLPGKSDHGEEEWYFFSPRDRKYPNGARPNRATSSGYWKATGTDKAIYNNNQYVGVKKALVFYKGRPPKGSKTGWIMHEYRLSTSIPSKRTKPSGSMRLDDWVLCRIYEKKHQKSLVNEEGTPEPEQEVELLGAGARQSPLGFPRSCSLAHMLEEEYMTISEMLNDYPLGDGDGFHAFASGFGSEDAGEGDVLGWNLDSVMKGQQRRMLTNQPPNVVDQQQPMFFL